MLQSHIQRKINQTGHFLCIFLWNRSLQCSVLKMLYVHRPLMTFSIGWINLCVRAKLLSQLLPGMFILHKHLAKPRVGGVAAGFMQLVSEGTIKDIIIVIMHYHSMMFTYKYFIDVIKIYFTYSGFCEIHVLQTYLCLKLRSSLCSFGSINMLQIWWIQNVIYCYIKTRMTLGC